MAMTFKFAADGTQYKRGLEKMRGETKAFAGGVTKMIGGMIGIGLVSAFKGWANELDRIGKIAARLGKTTDEVQKIALAAKLAGTDLNTVANALTKVEQNAGQAKQGLKTYGDAFERLGINTDKFLALSSDQQIIELAKAYQEAGRTGQGMADMLTVLGGRSKEMLPLLSTNISELRKSLDETNTVSAQTIKNAEQMNDMFEKLKNSASASAGSIVDNWRVVGSTIGEAAAQIRHLSFDYGRLTKHIKEKFVPDLVTPIIEDEMFGTGKKKEPLTPAQIAAQIAAQEKASGFAPTDPFAAKKFAGPGGAPAAIPKNQTATESESDLLDKYSELDTELGHMLDRADPPAAEMEKQKKASTSIIASSLASIGGGGGSAAFSSDPAMSEAKKQTSILETIATNTTPPGGTPTTPEL